MTMKASLTSGQRKQIVRVAEDAAETAIEAVKLDDKSAQRVLARGNELRAAILDAIRELSAEGKVFDLTSNIEAMIRAGYHEASGMSAEQYRALWPKSVTQPPEYAGRFDQVLLVDRTIAPEKLIALGSIVEYAKFANCTDLVDAPKGKDGKPLMRYVAFFQDGSRNLGRAVEDVRETYAQDEVGLVTSEGLHLPVQHEKSLRHHAVDLPGSRYSEFFAPYVLWFARARPELHADDVQGGGPRYGSASRGSQVIPIS